MAYNDTKSTGDSLTATEWNNMVLHLEDESSSHIHSGATDEGQKILVTDLDPTALTASQLLRTNAGVTAVESSGKIVPTGDIVGHTDAQTLTNKSIDSDNNTITNIVDADIKAAAAIAITKLAALTIDRALISNGSGFVSVATTTATEIGFVNGVTSAIQTQFGNKADVAAPTFTGNIKKSTTNGITAFATGGQASAIALTSDINEVSICATGGDSTKLPAAIAGMEIVVINHGAAAMDLFPASGDYINEAAVDTATSIAIDATAICYCYVADNWEVVEVGR